MTTWQFDAEFSLEEFIWAFIEPLLSLKPLARQYVTEGQICDILAITPDRQLVVLELKNVEDRYVVPQLTRYYASLYKEQPFADKLDYGKPICLLAIAPTFHSHNFVDREFNRLNIEFWAFEVHGDEDTKTFHLKALDSGTTDFVDIPPIFYSSLRPVVETEIPAAPVRVIGRPPKSFRGLMDGIDLDKQNYLLSLRKMILEFDEQMAEVGLSIRTQYGFRKGAKGIPDSRICAEFLMSKAFYRPVLHLMLPYPKGGLKRFKTLDEQDFVKRLGLARVPLFKEDWEVPTKVEFFLGKSRQFPSFGYSFEMDLYTQICGRILGDTPTLVRTEDLIELALREWQVQRQG